MKIFTSLAIAMACPAVLAAQQPPPAPVANPISQLANYMRLNGMLPPSALPRPRPGS